MGRNSGSTVDVAAQRVCDRDGVWYALDRLVLAGNGLYYSRPIAGSQHFHYHERWLLADHAWSVSRFTFHDDFGDRVDWYIEMDFIHVSGDLWRVRDGYLDVAVWEGARYEVWDADELGEGMLAQEISVEEAAQALDSLDRLVRALKGNGYSGAALLAEFAPGLPR